jgi:hypothetical protein
MFEQQPAELGLHVPRLLRGLLAVAILIGLVAVLAKYGDAGGTAFLFVVGAGFAFLIGRDVLRQRARTKDIREFAQRMGWLYIGSALPKTFPLDRTSSRTAHSVTRAVAGDIGRSEVLFFDCTIGRGRGRFQRGVVATRGTPEGFGFAQYGPDFVTEHVEDWMVVFGFHRLLLVEEINALISALSQRRE